jgi:dienelactone hydrolase
MVGFCFAGELEMLAVTRREKDRVACAHGELPAIQPQIERPPVEYDELEIRLRARAANTAGHVDHVPENDIPPESPEIHPGYVFENLRHGVFSLFH